MPTFTPGSIALFPITLPDVTLLLITPTYALHHLHSDNAPGCAPVLPLKLRSLSLHYVTQTLLPDVTLPAV